MSTYWLGIALCALVIALEYSVLRRLDRRRHERQQRAAIQQRTAEILPFTRNEHRRPRRCARALRSNR